MYTNRAAKGSGPLVSHPVPLPDRLPSYRPRARGWSVLTCVSEPSSKLLDIVIRWIWYVFVGSDSVQVSTRPNGYQDENSNKMDKILKVLVLYPCLLESNEKENWKSLGLAGWLVSFVIVKILLFCFEHGSYSSNGHSLSVPFPSLSVLHFTNIGYYLSSPAHTTWSYVQTLVPPFSILTFNLLLHFLNRFTNFFLILFFFFS